MRKSYGKMLNLDTNDLRWLEDKFERYHQFDREIAIRKEEMKVREVDENIGGGKSNIVGKPVETQVVNEQSDPFIRQRVDWKQGVDKTIATQSDEVCEIIKDKYWGDNSFMGWTDIGRRHGFAKSSIYRLRYKVLEDFARNIGYI